MFPTVSKAKIPTSESFPVSAKELSDALADVPQAQLLLLEFHGGWKSRMRSGNPYHREIVSLWMRPRPILEVGYGWVPNQSPEAQLPFKRGWLIVVLPVNRAKRHKINQAVKKQALPAIRNWLIERKNLRLSNANGIQSLCVLYDDEMEAVLLKHFQSPGETFQ